MSNKIVNAGILNNYTIKPTDLTSYTALRGVVDFSNIAQFDQYETGYSFLTVISLPKFITECAKYDDSVKVMAASFKHLLEYNFRGLSGLPNITSNVSTITDGNNELQMINDVVRDTSIEVSSQYYETRGSLITKFTEYYLTGIKDPLSKAKTYHGLIQNGKLLPGIENEVFTMMYFVTDNTYLRIEKAYLLANAQLSQAETSMYDSEKGSISNKELSITFRCTPLTGTEIDKAAKSLLEDITGVHVKAKKNIEHRDISKVKSTMIESFKDLDKGVIKHGVAALDSADYDWGILSSNTTLAAAANKKTK